IALSYLPVEALWACAYCPGATESATSNATQPARNGCPPNRETASMISTPSCEHATAEAHGASVQSVGRSVATRPPAGGLHSNHVRMAESGLALHEPRGSPISPASPPVHRPVRSEELWQAAQTR